jgi:hypothetical protein
MRILLLRPFGESKMTTALRKVVRNYLGPLGHVYTLSDDNYKPHPFLWFHRFIGGAVVFLFAFVQPLLRPSLRIATVTSNRRFYFLAISIASRFWPSLLSLLTGGESFNVRCSESWWKRCIDLLMHSSDLVVMDVSKVSTGSAWEIEQLTRRDMVGRCILIVQDKFESEGRQRLEALLKGEAGLRVHVFNEKGEFLKQQDIEAALNQHLRDAIVRCRTAAAARGTVAVRGTAAQTNVV